MKTRTLFFAAFLIVGASASAQSSVTFRTHYRSGDTDRYSMSMNMTGKMTMSMNMKFTERVAKVYPNGDADMSLAFGAGSMVVAGRTQAMPQLPSQNIRVNKYGQPIGKGGGGAMSGLGFDPSSMGSMLPHSAMRVGQTVPIHQSVNSGKMDGTIKLASVSNGIAKIIVDAKMASGQAGSMKMSMTQFVRVDDSKLMSATGTMTGLMGSPDSVAHLKLTRN